MTLHAWLRTSRDRLTRAGIPAAEAALDAELLARHALGWDRATLVARLGDEAPAGFEPRVAPLVERRTSREPIAYIRGTQEFWGRDFAVRPGVLIPRPETELVIEEVLARAAAPREPRVLDIGTGSGCLAVTLALELPRAIVWATDLSGDALDIARANAARLGAAVEFRHGPYLAGLAGPFDLIVSNPPYVAAGAHRDLQPEVRDHEPAGALVGGEDGLDVVRGIVSLAGSALAMDGLVMLEIGFDQAGSVRELIGRTEGLSLERIRQDLQGIPRLAVIGRKRPTSGE